MYDRPTAAELIDAVRIHLENAVLPIAKDTHHQLYFQTLVAVNVLKIVERELNMSSGHHSAEWERLNAFEGLNMPLPDTPESVLEALQTRNAQLCEAIRAGQYDDNLALLAHLKVTAVEALQVANPKLLAVLAQEDAAQ